LTQKIGKFKSTMFGKYGFIYSKFEKYALYALPRQFLFIEKTSIDLCLWK